MYKKHSKSVKKFTFYLFLISLVAMMILSFSRCADLTRVLNQMNIQKPGVRVSDVRMTGLGFDHTDLVFAIEINNPNSVDISMAGFDYNFFINQKSFLSGNQTEKVQVASRSKSSFDFPVTLKFTDVIGVVTDLLEQDSAGYKIDLGLRFDLPVLGIQNIPVSHSGQFPIPKIPAIRVQQLKLDQLGFTGAKLSLVLAMDNPNMFNLVFNQLDYMFSVNGIKWVAGKQNANTTISKNGTGLVSIPVALDFLSMGQSVYQLLSGTTSLEYNLSGSVDILGDIPLLKKQIIPFQQAGKIDLSR